MSRLPTRPSSESAALRFFVAGASGYVGLAVVREARARGIALAAHARPHSPRLAELAQLCAETQAELRSAEWSPAELAPQLQQAAPTHVFFLVGTTLKKIRADGTGALSYASVDLGLLQMFLPLVAALPQPARLIYLSSLGAGPKARGEYLRTRNEAEALVQRSGLAYTIARPGLISGSDRLETRPLERLGAACLHVGSSLGGLLLGPAFRDRYRPFSGRELAHGLVRAALAHTTIQRVLNAEELRWRTAVHRPDFAPRSARDYGRY